VRLPAKDEAGHDQAARRKQTFYHMSRTQRIRSARARTTRREELLPLWDDPTFNAQYQRIVEGLRKAGVPEGEKKAN
jgi:hypothetical protein